MKKLLKIILLFFDVLFENERYTNFYSDEWLHGLSEMPQSNL